MDGVNLTSAKAQWEDALQAAVRSFRHLTAGSNSKAWKLVNPTPSANAPSSSHTNSTNRSLHAKAADAKAQASKTKNGPVGKVTETLPDLDAGRSVDTSGPNPLSPSNTDRCTDARTFSTSAVTAKPFPASALPFSILPFDVTNVRVHKRSGGRATGLPAGVDVYRAVAEIPFEGLPDLSGLQEGLMTPETRTKWDRMVDHGETIEMLDPRTRINRIRFKLGWPASPRDAVMISRTMSDDTALINVATSLPRSADAPAYLKPAPPCVRSHVHLFACCIQLPRDDGAEDIDAGSAGDTDGKLRISIFWAWDLRGAWLGMPASGLGTHCTSMVGGLVRYARTMSGQFPTLGIYGTNIELLSSTLDTSRDLLTTTYCVLAEEPGRADSPTTPTGNDEVILQARRREAGTAVEFALPREEGWDVKVVVKASAVQDQPLSGWTAKATRGSTTNVASTSSRIMLRLTHDSPRESEDTVRVTVTIQRIAASSDIRLRINDQPQPVEEPDMAAPDADPALALDAPLLDDVAHLSDISLASTGTQEAAVDGKHKGADATSQFSASKRTTALASIVRRNYIYFTSMLQEPEAKWKHLSDNRGVTVTQLDSIDPTLVVYRAEATFVGVGVWDIFASISSPGTRSFWDKSVEQTRLIDDIRGISAVWHTKTRAAWPVSPRDSVMVETSYKAPSSVHLFSFSTDDRNLFPDIPAPASGTIRTQVDLRGWSIEALSPTTVHVTLIEQSDPKGWTSKSATPSMMTNAVAGVGEHAIKLGAPPVLTRLLGARTIDAKYDLDKATFKLEYSRDNDGEEDALMSAGAHNIECELRCDVESWCSNIDLVVDPPPINVSCLRRHKLSPGGGGLWLTIEHFPASLEDDAAKVTIRRGSADKERGIVTVNGAKLKVDIDELKENQVAQLKEQKRSKPQRIPLDLKQAASKNNEASGSLTGAASSLESMPGSSIPSRVGTPALDATEVAATNVPFSDKQPEHAMTPALDVLFLLRRIYADRSPDPAVNPAGWALTSQRNGLFIRRKLMQSISSTVAVQRGDKVVQGLTAEDMVAVVANLSCRRQWDERVENTRVLECFGDGASTSFVTTTGAFPFRGRGFYLSNITALAAPPQLGASDAAAASSPSFTAQSVFYHASASFPLEAMKHNTALLNPQALPIGKILIDGWIFETLDPYSSTHNYQIPSTRCTHIVAIDYAGSLPATVNTLWNANLPRGIQAVENFLKTRGALPAVRAPPNFVQVLGDGRDEDNDFVWDMEGGMHKRQATLLFSNFAPIEKRLEVVLQVPPRGDTVVPIRDARPQSRATDPPSADDSPQLGGKGFTTSGASLPRSPSMTEKTTSGPFLGPHKLLKATSTSSLRAAKSSGFLNANSASARTPRASLRGPQDVPAPPQALADIEVELKHYLAGYKIEVYSQLSATDAVPPGVTAGTGPTETIQQNKGRDEKPRVRDPVPLTTAAVAKKDIPIEAEVYELPPSAVLAATLDPAVRPRRHLLRLCLPREALVSRVSQDGSSDDDDDAESCVTDNLGVDWRDALRQRGATIRVVIRPVRGELTAMSNGSSSELKNTLNSVADDIDPQQIPVHFGGRRLDVIHVNKTSSMLQRELEQDKAISILRRVPRGSASNESPSDAIADKIPAVLATPIAADTSIREVHGESVQRRSGVETAGKGTSGNAVSDPSADTGESRATDDAESGTKDGKDGLGKGDTTKAEGDRSPNGPSARSTGGAAAATLTTASAATTHLMGLLQAYPLSRLSASTAVSTVSASRDGAANGSQDTKADGSNSGPAKANEASVNNDSSANGSTGVGLGYASEPPLLLGGRLLHEARFSLATVLATALICFLAGSLLRAMLSPADFILYPSRPGTQLTGDEEGAAGVAVSEVSRMLLSQTNGAVGWRKILRLIEIKRAIGGRFDLVLAVVDRRRA
ncbi:unnamed protein product [Parajaminaea phylloscopi]